MIKRIILVFTVLIMGLSAPNMVYAQNYDREEQINISVYEKLNPAIVSIDAILIDGVSAGTGCIVSADGLILTGSHVIDDWQKR